ncbi:hypothetical protein IW261DRAFT_1422817 [Armillaria novae-zelandiae]|uniref:Uncharacterized protein n=1 Tax=Armillaria novae-zelandiae TaxID=153914 RepID=A0AA39U9R8_9AGAR|nr:hypothetical protein IW261DRAFT_1422817 [Armillaria novae-zelandiae]
MSKVALRSYALLLSSQQPPSSQPLLWQALSGAILLEAERWYARVLGKTGVVSLSMFTGWHRSLQNRWYHYTLRGYNTAGWMVVTLEMQARNWGKAFTYGSSSWKAWASKAGGSNLPARYFFNVGDHKEFAGEDWDLITGIRIKRRPLLLLTGPKSEMDTAPLMEGDERRLQEHSDPFLSARLALVYYD